MRASPGPLASAISGRRAAGRLGRFDFQPVRRDTQSVGRAIAMNGQPMRTTTLLIGASLALCLAGCADAAATHLAAPSPAAAPSPGSTPAIRTAANTRGAARRSQDQDATDSEEWWKEGGVTREKINAMCWMKYEHGRKDLPLDKRADLVNQCVADALKKHPLP